MLNVTKINITPSHSIPHDSKKRTQREKCAIHRQERCDTNMQGASDNREYPVRKNSHTDKWKTMLPIQTKTTPVKKHNQRCNN